MEKSEKTTRTEQAKTFLTKLFPPMERQHRIDLLDRITDGAETTKDYIIMMILSTALASLGLLENSTAVVIGAMLVAPLMGPLIGAGMGITQGNASLFRVSLKGVIVGVAIGFLVSLLTGFLNPGFEPSLEIEARGEADVLDFAIAFFSGFVAAYALSNTKLASSIAGVAIAAALVPPLAATGVALTIGMPMLSLNAALLLVTNIVAIILGASAAFRLFGLHKSIEPDNKPKWIKRTLMFLGLCSLILLIPLYEKQKVKQKAGQTRPLALPVASDTREKVNEFLELQPNVELITMSRISVEPDSGVMVLLVAYGSLKKSFKTELIRIIRQSRGKDINVKVILLKGKMLEEDELDVEDKW
jgi:uncharacterized hydrophobic protein (TIGR00271 family)